MQSPDGTAKPSRAAEREQKIRDLHAELQRLEAEHLSMMGAEKTLGAGPECGEVSAPGPGSEWKNDDEVMLERSAQGERKRDERTPTITLSDSEDEDEGGDSSLA